MAADYLTTGRWSPTRPGVLFLGKVDGSMDVWDFTDSSYAPSVNLMSSPSKITRYVGYGGKSHFSGGRLGPFVEFYQAASFAIAFSSRLEAWSS